MYSPVGNNIIIDADTKQEENVTETGINLGSPSDISHKTVASGDVISVGKDVEEVKVGDRVLYETHAAHSFEVKGKEYLVVQEASVVGYRRNENG